MADIVLEQALFDQEGQCLARSPGFAEVWEAPAQQLVAGFGRTPLGLRCPLAVFAYPLTANQVAIVQVSDASGAGLRFHVLVMSSHAYQRAVADPFALARRFPAPWTGRDLSTLHMPDEAPPQRTVADVRRVLLRVKAAALREDEDPDTVERSPENSESPALLGGVQVLVDGGKLVFERPAPDPDLVEGLWTLLPHTTRARLWPTSFAFSNALGFDVVVLPHVPLPFTEGYTLEEHAADYPEGRYELALQTAAESGDQAHLDALLSRRSSRDTLRLAVVLLVFVSLVVWLIPRGDDVPTPPRDRLPRLATAAAVVSFRDPWSALVLIDQGNRRFLEQD